MKIKLDENIGRRGVDLLRQAGHDVMTVRDQNLQGASDDTLFGVCAGECSGSYHARSRLRSGSSVSP